MRDQDKAEGHAVRAVYLYTGMAEVASRTEDRELFEACEKLWDNIVNRQMYVTGAIGATEHGKPFLLTMTFLTTQFTGRPVRPSD